MRDLKKVVYTSSYDRGLDILLKLWPDIKKEVPDATLDIAYGWQLFDMAHKNNPSSMAWKAKVEKGMKYEGVTHHGRLPQPEVKKLMEDCGIWAYPTYFGEISCISAIKAQAYGCEPVVVNYAALKETVRYGKKIEGDIYDQETQDKFKKALIDTLRKPMSDIERKIMMSWAKDKYGWDKIAKTWSDEFGGVKSE